MLRDTDATVEALENGVDTRYVIDSLIRSIGSETPEHYFTNGKGVELKTAYDALVSSMVKPTSKTTQGTPQKTSVGMLENN